jgi:acyl-CoA synthetase (AMP-forming)/AMP-acid ligase II
MGRINSGIISNVIEYSERFPDKIALIFPDNSTSSGQVEYNEVSYKELNKESNSYAHGLSQLGFKRGMKVLFLIRPGLEFVVLTFSLGKIGAIPVFIDPGMGKKALLKCIGEVEPDAMITVPQVLILKKFFPKYFNSIKYSITTSNSWLSSEPNLKQISTGNQRDFTPVEVKEDDPFAIVFTTGSTGSPKGVVYHHRTLNAQIRTISKSLFLNENDIVLEAFAPFALRDVAMGATCLLPKMDSTKPSEVDPELIVSAIESYGTTFSFGSPAFWSRIASFCMERNIKLPSLKNVMLAGAPISFKLIQDLKSVLNNDAEVHTPYGATEALPLTSISGTEILENTCPLTMQGLGICVGKALHGVTLKILKISDKPIELWNEELVLNVGEIGEIVVKGEMVTQEYFKRPEQTKLSKILEGEHIWHRMGDVGYLDDENRLWYCGRKSHRVINMNQNIFSLPCESIFNNHQDIYRSALVGVGEKGNQRPIIIVEPKKGRMPTNKNNRQKLISELLDIGGQNEVSREIKDILFHPRFPVDYRHNAKIIREKLAKWASRKIK